MKLKNKIIILVLCLTFFSNPLFVNAQENKYKDLQVKAECAYVCDFNSGTEIFAKNESQRKPIASMTKIMILSLFFENHKMNNIKLDEKIRVSERASSMGGSQVFLQANKDYLTEDLVKSIIIASANDATVAIAERLYGSEEKAIEAMNKKAKELKLTNTLFSNTTGLTKPTQYSTAKDVAIMLKELLKYDLYYKYSSIFLDELHHPDGQVTQLTNTNKLIKFYEGCDGGKTGFTNEAGYCLAATAKRGSTRIISVIINEPDSKTRFTDCTQIFNYAFANYASKQVLSADQQTEYTIEIKNAKKQFYEIYPKNSVYIFSEINKKDEIKIEFIKKGKLVAPIKANECIGDIIVYVNGKKYQTVNAVIKENAERKSLFDIVDDITSLN